MSTTKQPLFNTGDRIIRVGDNLNSIRIGDKMIAGEISENGRLVCVGDFTYRADLFKKLIVCKGNDANAKIK